LSVLYSSPPDPEDLDLQATQSFVERENQSLEGEAIWVVLILVSVATGILDWWSLKGVKAGVGRAKDWEWDSGSVEELCSSHLFLCSSPELGG
jgi:hypothetical protein